MGIIVPPSVTPQVRTNHPSKPVSGEDEDFVEYLTRCGDHWIDNPPPAPEGFELMECTATPRHWPEYRIVDDDFYPGFCSGCQYQTLNESHRRLRCKADHRKWKSWKMWWRIAGRLYTLGITSSGGGVSYGRCEFCGIGRQHHAPRWRGKRPYILGVQRETWTCLLRYHHRRQLSHYTRGLCTVCLPCPECGSTNPTHFSCEATV